MTLKRAAALLVALGIVFLVVAFAVGFPKNVASDEVYVIRGAGATSGAKITGPVSPSDGNLWLGAAIPTLIIGIGLYTASRQTT